MPSHLPLTMKNSIKRINVLDFGHYKDVVTDLEVTFFWQTRFRVDLAKLVQLQNIIPFSFSRKFLLTRAYTNGLKVELNSTSI